MSDTQVRRIVMDGAPTVTYRPQPQSPKVCPVAQVLSDNEQWQKIKDGAQSLRPLDGRWDHQASEILEIQLVLLTAGSVVPPARNHQELIAGLERFGWRLRLPFQGPPVAGCIWISCEESELPNEGMKPLNMGFVGKVDTEGKFFLDVRRHKTYTHTVQAFLVPPGG
jgi:hypothetical protein